MQRHSFELPLVLDRESGEPYKRQIGKQIEWLILSGRLQPADRLPSIACLTSMLHVARNTVLGAYECLIDAELVRGEANRGFFVADNVPRAAMPTPQLPTTPRDALATPSFGKHFPILGSTGVHTLPPAAPVRFDFRIGRPATDAFPARRWAALSSTLLRQMSHAVSDYTPPEGLWGLRTGIADHLAATRALAVDPEQIIIVAGAQEALHLAAAQMVRPGSRVVVEAPGYAGFCNLPQLADASPIALPVDTDGLCTDALPPGPASLAYVTPSHQYPLGVTMSMCRRRALLAWAARSGACIVEDDYDADFRYESSPLPPLMAIDPSRVIYVGTFSKVLGPGTRLGFMACPPHLVEVMARRKALLNQGCPWLEQAVLARLLERGDYNWHVYRLRQRYRAQRDVLVEGIRNIWGNTCEIVGPGAGLHLALRLPLHGPDARTIAHGALRSGIRVYTLEEAACRHGEVWQGHTLLLGYASMNAGQIAEAMTMMRAVVDRA
ncbi:PLP-dependent aminotransferase family protein [Cupriavidus sp. DL-D2]|uniref:MocR-like pyridoxine biosynthesis transcription factor PdxR n=1 Tax=Cupriavidus sp. DL-D2 TaxID=3144974 RepID=UPI003215F455